MSDYLTLLEYGKKAVDDYVATVERELARAWQSAYKDVEKSIADLYAKLGEDINLPDAAKYKRLENLKAEIEAEFRKLTGKAITAGGDTGFASYTGAFQSNWFGMDMATGLDLTFGFPPVDAIRASVFSEITGAAFPQRFGTLYTTTVDKVAQAITRALATGQGYAKTARDVKEIWAGSYANAIRVIRTESTRNFTEGSLYAYQEAEKQGIEGAVTWLATFDLRTRPDHARLNGKEADKKGLFYIGTDSAVGPGMFGLAANSVNCRCSTYYKLKGFEQDYTPDWTYSQWKTQYDEWKQLPPKERSRKL